MNEVIQESFFNEHQARFSSETIRSYQLALNQFFAFCDKAFDVVRAKDIRLWLESMYKGKLEPRSIHVKLSAVKSFYRFCLEENLLKKNPTLTIETPKIEDSIPCYLSKRQLALLQELVKENKRERALIETLYVTGVRISELLQIRLEDVKWDKRQIWIRKGKGNKERFVLFTHDCAERLNLYLKHRNVKSDYLFCNVHGGRLSQGYIQRNFREYSELLGFKISPHTLRHTFATHLAIKGMPQSYIQELLGHSNINSTRIYTRLMQQAQKEMYDRFHT